MTTSLADMDAQRGPAVAAIAEAWGVLAGEHVVACSRYRPYIQVGRDYQGGRARGTGCKATGLIQTGPDAAGIRFANPARAAYPDRRDVRNDPGQRADRRGLTDL
jgi:hypothetical protein